MIFKSDPRDHHAGVLLWQWGVPVLALCAMTILLLLSDNVSLFLFLNRNLSALGDPVWSHFTLLGDATVALLLFLPFIGRRPEFVWQFVLAAVLASLVSHGLKELFSEARPPALLPEGSFHLIGQKLRKSSFPSGHTITAFTLAGLFCLQICQGATRYVLLLLAVLIGLSRIACGVHWPLDVLGGMAVGWTCALGGIRLGQRWRRSGENIRLQRGLSLLGIVLAIWAMSNFDNALAGTEWMQFLISVSCLALSLPGLMRLWKVGT